MPIIQVQHPRSSLSAEQKAAIAARLTEVLLQMEGGACAEGGKAFAAVSLDPAGPRFAWARLYFDAMARQRAGAGNPAKAVRLLPTSAQP
ncbi:MAG TPA: hypothetical protein PKC97_11195 [Burkholderiaceae bacterium]|jgi:hypothetical protein|nr:hypothetical protein [Burkholderiaceae bacterium]